MRQRPCQITQEQVTSFKQVKHVGEQKKRIRSNVKKNFSPKTFLYQNPVFFAKFSLSGANFLSVIYSVHVQAGHVIFKFF